MSLGCGALVAIFGALLLAAGPAAGADRSRPGVAPSLRINFPENWMWMRYTQPRIMFGTEHQEEGVSRVLFNQRLDHLNPEDTRTWAQDYRWSNASSLPGGAGPAFVMLGGTSDYLSDWLRSGQMADLARQFHADRYFFSTRFYSLPYPTDDSSVSSLQYLSTEQILQDVRAFLSYLRESGRLAREQRVVLFGAGYAGAIAIWARKRFPDLVHAAVVSGAVLEPRIQLSAYFPIVTYAVSILHQKDLQCKNRLEEAFVELDSLLDTKEGRQTFNDLFDPCTPFAVDTAVPVLDRAQAMGMVASFVADMVQENVDSQDGDTLQPLCATLRAVAVGETLVSALAEALKLSEYGRCFQYTFDALRLQAMDESWENPQNKWGLRPWLWQQCTELGLFATSSSSSFPYTSRITMDFHKSLCAQVFGDSYDYNDLLDNMRDLLSQYGGRKPDVTNVIFIKGDLDPWKESSPADMFSSDTHPVLTVRRASHAHDMFRKDHYDPPRLKAARKKVAAILRAWLQ